MYNLQKATVNTVKFLIIFQEKIAFITKKSDYFENTSLLQADILKNNSDKLESDNAKIIETKKNLENEKV